MLRARLTRADRLALVSLVLVPVILNLPWALAGHPVLDGDNLAQNYPLRVLAGQLIAHGRLPLWDAGIWSGVPLLAGWNAGAMFPATWLFAVLAPVAAYELNVIVTGIVCGVGFYLFLRRSQCSPLASLLGALTWSEMGFVSGQAVHLGLIQGTALAAWILLAIDGMFRASKAGAHAGHWIALLGAAGGLAVLAGDPRAVSNDAIIAVIYLAARCWRQRAGQDWRSSLRALRSVAAGGVLSVSVSAVQWLPGLSYLHSSQRSVSSLALFGYYSLGWNSLPLLAVPYLIGGNGNFAMPVYNGPLNLPEVTYAVGILPLIALFALLSKLVRAKRAVRSGEEPGLGVWYVMFLAGAVLTTGSMTPLGHLLVHIPLYGGQRDQNRNAAIADFALAALLAIFVDGLRAARAEQQAPWRERLERVAGTFPVAAVIGLVAAMFIWTKPMERWLGVATVQPRLAVDMAGYYAAAVLIALAGAVVLLRRTWRSTSGRRRAAATVVLADVLLVVVMASYQPVPLAALAPANSALATLRAQLPPGSRIAIDDPDQLALSYPAFLTDELGVNDLVLLHAVDSVQGYGSAVPEAYDAATGTHDVENLLPSALLGSTFDDLDLGLVVVVPEQFGTILTPGEPVPIPPGPPVALGTSAADRQPGGVARAPYPPAGPWRLGAGISWQMPAPTRISSVTVAFDPAYGPLPAGDVRVAVRLADGSTVSASSLAPTVASASASVMIPLPAAEIAAGGGALALTVTAAGANATSAVIGAIVVTADAAGASLGLHQPDSGTVRYALNGLLQGLLTPPHWMYAGRVGPLVMYRNTRARGQAWLEAPAARVPAAAAGAGSVTTLPVAAWQDPVTLVTSTQASLLVRSEQYAPGWSATVQPIEASGALGPASSLPVRAVGILQGVEVPAGSYRVTWHYHSTRVDIGLLLSALGSLACAAAAIVGLRRRRAAAVLE